MQNVFKIIFPFLKQNRSLKKGILKRIVYIIIKVFKVFLLCLAQHNHIQEDNQTICANTN